MLTSDAPTDDDHQFSGRRGVVEDRLKRRIKNENRVLLITTCNPEGTAIKSPGIRRE